MCEVIGILLGDEQGDDFTDVYILVANSDENAKIRNLAARFSHVLQLVELFEELSSLVDGFATSVPLVMIESVQCSSR